MHGIEVANGHLYMDSNKYRQIHDAFEKTGRHWLYNATVGAGLPINHTVRDLIDSGDTILSISGIFSGTLSSVRLFSFGEKGICSFFTGGRFFIVSSGISLCA